MDPLILLTLYWRGFRLPLQRVYELLSLDDDRIEAFLQEYKPQIPANWKDLGRSELQWCRDQGVHVIPFWHPQYPKNFLHLDHPPWLLTWKGPLTQTNEPRLAVVGSRQLSWGARHWMETEFDNFLKRTRVVIVSGGARGADQLAHRLSILNERPTLCALPSGLAQMYPENLRLLEKDLIQGGGAFFSAYGPFEKMRKHHFIFRNELIASLARQVFVVEARPRSGSYMTATRALKLGADVAVLPSTPTPQTFGGLFLIQNGAHMILEAKDLEDYIQLKPLPFLSSDRLQNLK